MNRAVLATVCGAALASLGACMSQTAAPSVEGPVAAQAVVPSGGLLSGAVGASLSEADRQAAFDAQIAALEAGQRRSWRGSHGIFGFIEPGSEIGTAGCRSYSQTIYIAGRPNKGNGQACRQPEGGWRMAS
jgi:surface antigen